jgi:2-keto-4-pentenoate hydratase/2-oxohepta-3-ene-1,7-dioic acid hydratase in catechol pathway
LNLRLSVKLGFDKSWSARDLSQFEVNSTGRPILRLVSYNGGRIGLVKGTDVFDESKIIGVGQGDWPSVEMNRQHANTRNLIVGMREMIATGTPAGVGTMAAGDTVTIEIEKVSRTSLPFVQGDIGTNFVFDRTVKEPV